MATAWQKALRRGTAKRSGWKVLSAREIRPETCEVEVDTGREGLLVARRYPDGQVASLRKLSDAEKLHLSRAFARCPKNTATKLSGSKPTIFEALRNKLGREPTNPELKADVDRIKREALTDLATRGKLRHQRRSR